MVAKVRCSMLEIEKRKISGDLGIDMRYSGILRGKHFALV